MKLKYHRNADGDLELWEDNSLCCIIPDKFIEACLIVNDGINGGMEIKLKILKSWSLE